MDAPDFSLFLCGDVMTGRGIDQILPHPSDPLIHESYIRNAIDYVTLAERVNGPIPRAVSDDYIWGEALHMLDQMTPDKRIVNLETSVTTSDNWMPKGINYRMNPRNISCLTRARIDCCTLANNHVLDWGPEGLDETLSTLKKVGIQTAGAGLNLRDAQSPAILKVPDKGNILVFAAGTYSSGIPPEWAAHPDRPGVNFIPELSFATQDDFLKSFRNLVAEYKTDNALVVFSIHWGGNWGYDIPPEHRHFAHRLIDEAGVDIVHGHSSHHVMGLELYKGKLILYGCGDFLNDYEGIGGYEEFRGDLSLMYFPKADKESGRTTELKMVPTRIHRFQLRRAEAEDARWITNLLNREGEALGTRFRLAEDLTLSLIL